MDNGIVDRIRVIDHDLVILKAISAGSTLETIADCFSLRTPGKKNCIQPGKSQTGLFSGRKGHELGWISVKEITFPCLGAVWEGAVSSRTEGSVITSLNSISTGRISPCCQIRSS